MSDEIKNKAIKGLKNEGIKLIDLAIELSNSCVKYNDNLIVKSFEFNDESYHFKVEGNLAQALYLYVSTDDCKSWIFIDSWTDH
jgi:hypothetical protein